MYLVLLLSLIYNTVVSDIFSMYMQNQFRYCNLFSVIKTLQKTLEGGQSILYVSTSLLYVSLFFPDVPRFLFNSPFLFRELLLAILLG